MAKKEQEIRERGAIKDPKDWTTGEEPMTGAQESYLTTLAREAGEPVKEELTKAEASEMIEELRHKTGRDETSAAKPKRAPRKKRG